jgi:hypothetical protein
MRKRVGSLAPDSSLETESHRWLDLESIAEVEVTSEDQGHPIEAALLPAEEPGWRACAPGPQTIRLRFDKPQNLSRIRLSFEEKQTPRTQEFVLRSSSDSGKSFRDIVRQQWNFSPPGSARELEEYSVDLPGVSVLELTIVPDISGGPAHASLLSMRVG